MVYSHGYGMSNLEDGVAITQGSIFQVGSIAKQFTAFAIALLASEGKLSLDDDIHRYLPELPDYGAAVTIRQLIAHTAGFPDFGFLLRRAGWRFADITTEQDVLDVLSRHRSLNFRPGSEFLYSNYGLHTIGDHHSARFRPVAPGFCRIANIRAAGHERYAHPGGSPGDRAPTAPLHTKQRPGGGFRINIPNWDISGSTNLFTTAGDLLKWEQNLVDRRVGGEALVDAMQHSGHLNDGSATSYGFGLLIEPYRGVRTINHSGATRATAPRPCAFPIRTWLVVIPLQPRRDQSEASQPEGGGDRAWTACVRTACASGAHDAAAMEKLAGTYWSPATREVWRIRSWKTS